MSPKERAAAVEDLIQGRYTIPFSRKSTLSKTTLYRWLKAFREGEDAGRVLLGKIRSDKGTFPSLTEEQKAALLRWRYENAYRTAEDLREELLSHESTCQHPVPSVATIGRFLGQNGLSRANLLFGNKPQAKIRLAFEAEYPQQVWMADTKGPDIYVADPQNPTRQVQAKPIALLDDQSRYIVAVRYVIVENEAAVMSLFCQAILLYGIPEILYLDRGSPYMGKSLKRAAGLIGCNILHAAKAEPESKGKIEKVLRTIHERFEHEMKASGKAAATLEEYNQYLAAYIGQDYHREVHDSTGQSPEERFFAYPARLRRWITKDSLMLIFMPCRTARVSKTGLVRVNTMKYLVQDAFLWGKKVEVRYDPSELRRVYVWYEEKYYGEAAVFTEENDFLQREILTEKVNRAPELVLPEITQVPIYGRLERQLARHREEMEAFDVNGQISYNRQKKQEVRSALVSGQSANISAAPPVSLSDFGVDAFLYLLMKLLRKKFTPSERLAVHALWKSVGPIEESMVRRTVGRLLGEEHPVEDIKGYLEEIRLCILTKNTM
jgi:transposase InsO family protein